MQSLERGLVLAGRYELIDRLGVGGMSQVWRGEDRVLDRLVAVKVLSESLLEDDASRELLRREARAMARLSHPHVTSVHDYGEFASGDAHLPFIVMELLHGQTLERAMAGGPLPASRAAAIGAQVAAALAAAHRQGLVHCDVTPSNVMLTDDGVKVLDFGIAALLGGHDASGRARFGTAGYVAPERLSGAGPATPASDVFSLGVLLCAALTGHRPEDRDDSLSVADDARSRLAATPGIPAGVIEVCVRCLAGSPGDRPGSSEVARVLGGVPAAAPVPAPGPATLALTTTLLPPPARVPVPAPAAPSPPRPGRPALLAAGMVALAILALAAVLLLQSIPGRQDARPQTPGVTSSATAGPAPATGSAATTATPTPTRGPVTAPQQGPGVLAAVANLRQLVVGGQVAGEIRAQCAEDLISRINDLQRRINEGDTDNARQRVEQIGEEIDDRAEDGDVSAPRATDLRRALAAIDV